MRLICLVLLMILASCSNVTNSSTHEVNTEYENVRNLTIYLFPAQPSKSIKNLLKI